MRRLFYIIQKEFIQILGNKAMLPLMTIAPIMQIIVLAFAADSEVKNVRLAIVDQDRSIYARQLIGKIQQSDRFVLVAVEEASRQADVLMQQGEVDITLVISPKFEHEFHKEKRSSLQLLVNAINGQQASVGAAYLTAIVQDFNQSIRGDAAPRLLLTNHGASPTLDIHNRYWYNPQLNYKHFMVPGLLGEIVTILVLMLTAMNIVREREIGTIEQINVTPIKKWQFILGKLIPFLIIGLFLMTVGLFAGKIVFDIPLRGNLWLVFGYCIINLMSVLGLGLFISNISDTQQQAMFTTFFFVIIFVLMCGLFTPIESMPSWAQKVTVANPIAHFVNVMRSVLLKGSDFADIAHNFKATAVLAVLFNALAIASYRKTT